MRCYFKIAVAISLAFTLLLAPVVSAAEKSELIVERDSLSADYERSDNFDARQLILPGALIALGAFGVENGWMKRINRGVRKGMLHLSGGHRFKADNVIEYVPAAAYLALCEFNGIKHTHNFRDRAIILATSFAAMCAITQPVKHIVGEMRPDNSSDDSFPSGHTATAFMGAELLRNEYSIGIGVAAYSVACGVGFLRLYNNRHWLNDVVAGAGIGILSARIGIWMLPVWKRVFHFGEQPDGMQIALMPSYNMQNKAISLGGTIKF